MISTSYRIRRLASQLAARQAKITGKATMAGRQYWIVQDKQTRDEYHVPVCQRKDWAKYDHKGK